MDEVRAFHEALLAPLSAQEADAAAALGGLLPDWQAPRLYHDLSDAFIRQQTAMQGMFAPEVCVQINRLFVVQQLLKLDGTLAERPLPPEILALYPAARQRLLHFLQHGDVSEYFYPHENFVKDVRFVAGMTVPAGAMILDLRSYIGWKPSLTLLQKNPLPVFMRFAGSCYRRPWLRAHIEMRYRDEFTPDGLEDFYRRTAALLRAQPQLQGIVASSWFYDPMLESVSPRLKHLWQVPMARGAFVVRGYSGAYDVEMATKTSATRRRLYEAGVYQPSCTLLVWPRKALMAWAGKASL
ncbi:MAG: hypothetical protein EBX37_08370 [Alphaproteobacteria bacterium]|nr:hypothetical protein [Alphaproteobacteria bacterium]